MVNTVVFGHYIPGRSFLHRLSPRFKLISLLILPVALFIISGFQGLGIFLLLIAGIYF